MQPPEIQGFQKVARAEWSSMCSAGLVSACPTSRALHSLCQSGKLTPLRTRLTMVDWKTHGLQQWAECAARLLHWCTGRLHLLHFLLTRQARMHFSASLKAGLTSRLRVRHKPVCYKHARALSLLMFCRPPTERVQGRAQSKVCQIPQKLVQVALKTARAR